MTRKTAISLARQALEKEDFLIKPEPAVVMLVPAEEFNRHLTATQVKGPQWVIAFPLLNPNDFQEMAGVSIDDITGAVSEGLAS